MIAAYYTEPPLLFIDSPHPSQDRETATEAPLLWNGLLISSVHYRPTKDRNTQIGQHEAVQFKNLQRLTNEYQSEASISESYSKYLEKFLQILTQLSSMWNGHPGWISIAKYKIELLLNSNPVFSAPSWAGAAVWVLQRSETDKMVFQKVIEAAQSEQAASIVFASKKNILLCFCGDSKKLNSFPLCDSDYILRTDECTNLLEQANFFSTLDTYSKYWQTVLDKEHRHKTELTSHHGLYRCVWLLVGLKNALGAFQQDVDVILTNIQWQYVLANFGDKKIFSKTLGRHIEYENHVLTLLRPADATS